MKTNISKALKTSSVLVIAFIFTFTMYFAGGDNTVSAAPPRTWSVQVVVNDGTQLRNAINNAANNVPTLIKVNYNGINISSSINISANKIIKIASGLPNPCNISTTYNINNIIYNEGELWTENIRFIGNSSYNTTAIGNSGKYIMQNGTVLANCAIGVMNSNSFEMEGGEIHNISNICVQNHGNFLMSGGKIHDSKTAVYNGNGSEFIMNNGEIYNCNSSAVENYYRFTMTNGKIYNNVSSNWYGGGITNFNGTVVITGGEISGNTADKGGGISNINYTHGTGTVTISNARIINNTALTDGGGIHTADYSKLIVRNTVFSGNTAGVKYTGNLTTADQTIHNSNTSGNTYTSNNPAFQWLYNNYDVNYTPPVLTTVIARTNSSLISVSADAALGMPALSTTQKSTQARRGSTYKPTVNLQYAGLSYTVYMSALNGAYRRAVISNSTAVNPSIAITEDCIIEFYINDRPFNVNFFAENRPQGGGPITASKYGWAATNGVTECNVYYSPEPSQILLQDGTSVPFTSSIDSSGHRIVKYTLNPFAWTPAEAAQKGFANDTYRVKVVW